MAIVGLWAPVAACRDNRDFLRDAGQGTPG